MDAKRISRVGQIKIYLGKCFRLFQSEKQWKNFISTLIIILIISFVTGKEMFRQYPDTKNGTFAIISACIWVGLFNSIRSICRERDIIKREHRTGLHISSYILAHVIYEAVLCFGETLIILMTVLIKNISHLPEEGVIFPMAIDLFLTYFLVTFASDMIAIMISSIVKEENSAMTIMPFVLIIQLVMSGSVFQLEGVSKAISNITVSKWGMNGIISVANTFPDVRHGGEMMRAEGVDPTAGNLAGIWLILLGFACLYIVISILFLKGVDKDQR